MSHEEQLGAILSCQTKTDPDKWKKPPLNQVEDNLDDVDKNILKCLAQGMTNKTIASEVYLSIPAIKKRIRLMLKNTGAKNSTELIFLLSSQAA